MIGGTNLAAASGGGKDYVVNSAPNFAWLENSKIYEGFIGYWLNEVLSGKIHTLEVSYNNYAKVLLDVAGAGEILALKFSADGSGGSSSAAIFEFEISTDGIVRHFIWEIASSSTYYVNVKRTGILVADAGDVKAINETGGLSSVSGSVPTAETIDDLFADKTYRTTNFNVFTMGDSWRFNSSFKIESFGRTGGNTGISASAECLVKVVYKLD